METLHNQELVATILEDNVANELTTIQDFLRWTYSTFNRSVLPALETGDRTQAGFTAPAQGLCLMQVIY